MKIQIKNLIQLTFVILCSWLVWIESASAIPAFARKYDRQCSSCHTAYPALNQVGRQFKEAGYRFESVAALAIPWDE